ncbi:MAG: NIL domain-containing protein [Bacillota bacterium]|jgi:ferredoxin
MKKMRFILEFPPECSDKPFTYHLVKDYDLRINILRGTITAGKEGKLLVEVEAEEENIQNGLDFLSREGISIKPMSQQVVLDQEKCIHCGACTGVCFSGALRMDPGEWKLLFEPEKCLACELCAAACPLQLIAVGFD